MRARAIVSKTLKCCNEYVRNLIQTVLQLWLKSNKLWYLKCLRPTRVGSDCFQGFASIRLSDYLPMPCTFYILQRVKPTVTGCSFVQFRTREVLGLP